MPNDRFSIAALGVLVLAVSVPHLVLGVPLFHLNSGHDSSFHLQMLHWLAAAPWRGVLPPAWLFEASGGLGSPAPVFYGVGAYVPALVFHGLGAGLDMALSLTLALARILGMLGVVVWMMRRGASWPEAAIATAIFALSPFILLNGPFMAFRFPEAVATGLLPWLFVLADRTTAPRAGLRHILPMALGFGLLAMVHLQQTLLAALILPAWILMTRGRASALRVVLGGLLGVALAAWLLLPALSLRGLINEQAWQAGERMGMSLFGPWLSGRLGAGWEGWPFWATLYASWFIGMALGLMGLLLRGTAPDGSRAACGFALVLGLTMVPPLVWVWPHVPMLIFVQFPWRHLTFLALFAGAAAAMLWRHGPRWVVALLLVMMAGPLALPWAGRLPAAPDAVFPLFPQDRAAATARRLAEDVSPAEYLPAGAVASAFAWQDWRGRARILAAICAEESCATLDRSSPGALRAQVQPGQLLPHFYWPGLVCEGCDLRLDPRTGLARVDLPAAGAVTIRAAPLAAQTIGATVSGATLLLILLLILIARAPRSARRPPPATSPPPGPG